MSRKIDRTGERFINNEGYEFVIIEYNNARDVTIQFQDEHKAILEHKRYFCCEDGSIKNPYHPNKYGGYIGQGKYKSRDEQGNKTKCYRTWMNRLKSCYDKEVWKEFPNYEYCFFNKDMLDFQKFGEWFDNNYYEIEGETMHLDKDILVKGNKEYAPDKMIFVPERINTLFCKSDASRGEFPIGVSYHKTIDKYTAKCSIGEDGYKFLGYYNTPHEAFLAYKEFKEAYIKQIADEYKERIPDRLYEALYKWEVEEND